MGQFDAIKVTHNKTNMCAEKFVHKCDFLKSVLYCTVFHKILPQFHDMDYTNKGWIIL